MAHAFVVYAEYLDGDHSLIGVTLTLQEARDLGARWCLDRPIGWPGWKDVPEEINGAHVWRSRLDDPQIVIYEAPLMPSLNGSQYTHGGFA